MNFESVKKSLSVVLSLALIATASQMVCDAQTPPSTTAADGGSPTETAPQTASELQALVAPIALYPDSLVAQILTASTFPDQVAIANYWFGQNKSLTGSALMQAVDKQSWDAKREGAHGIPLGAAHAATWNWTVIFDGYILRMLGPTSQSL